MDIYQNISEYYDELYPVSAEQKKFYTDILNTYAKPAKLLGLNCGTGNFEFSLAKEDYDVTGLETIPDLLASANRKRWTQTMSMRFFNMSTLEMARFLGKKFYNVISVCDSRIIFTHDKTLMNKFFYDCHELLSDGGSLILVLPNFEKFAPAQEPVELPVRESIRVSLFTRIVTDPDGQVYEEQILECGNGKMQTVTSHAPIFPLTKNDISELAKKSGFSKIDFYGDFAKSEFTKDCDELIAVIR